MPLTNPAASGGSIPDVWLPANQGLLAQSCDPAIATAVQSVGSGVFRSARIPIQTGKTVTNLVTYTSGGTTLTGAIGLLYKLDGTLIARTPSQNTAWSSAGIKTMALTPEAGQSLALPAADVIGAVMVVTASGAPGFLATSPGVGPLLNATFSSPAYRGAYLTGQSGVPSPLSGLNSDTSFVWLALS